jgi:hypothetical protein
LRFFWGEIFIQRFATEVSEGIEKREKERMTERGWGMGKWTKDERRKMSRGARAWAQREA